MSTTRLLLLADDAADLMTARPVALDEATPLAEAAKVLTRFSAVPVVDADKRVVGVLSRTDLVRSMGDGRPVATLEVEQAEEGATVEYTPPRRVAEVVNRQFYSVTLGASAIEVIRHMVDKAIGRVFVVDDSRRLVGVISSTDVLMALRADG